MKGKKEDDVNVKHLTISQSKSNAGGVYVEHLSGIASSLQHVSTSLPPATQGLDAQSSFALVAS